MACLTTDTHPIVPVLEALAGELLADPDVRLALLAAVGLARLPDPDDADELRAMVRDLLLRLLEPNNGLGTMHIAILMACNELIVAFGLPHVDDLVRAGGGV
jgi:hypothetical protein